MKWGIGVGSERRSRDSEFQALGAADEKERGTFSDQKPGDFSWSLSADLKWSSFRIGGRTQLTLAHQTTHMFGGGSEKSLSPTIVKTGGLIFCKKQLKSVGAKWRVGGTLFKIHRCHTNWGGRQRLHFEIEGAINALPPESPPIKAYITNKYRELWISFKTVKLYGKR